MNVHDVVRASQVIEEILSGHTTLNALERMELLLAFQSRLINTELNKSAAVRSSADSTSPAPVFPQETGGGFRLTPVTSRGSSMIGALENVLARIPHTGDM